MTLRNALQIDRKDSSRPEQPARIAYARRTATQPWIHRHSGLSRSPARTILLVAAPCGPSRRNPSAGFQSTLARFSDIRPPYRAALRSEGFRSEATVAPIAARCGSSAFQFNPIARVTTAGRTEAVVLLILGILSQLVMASSAITPWGEGQPV